MAELNNTVVRGNLIAMGRIVTDNASFGTVNVSRLTSNSVTANQVFMGEGGAATISSTEQSVGAEAVSSKAGRTYLVQKDGAGNLVVNVPWDASVTTTGDISATATDGIFDLTASGGSMSVSFSLQPYPIIRHEILSFDTTTTNPTGTNRLNLNGYLYATKLYSGGTEVSVVGHTHSYSTTDTKNTVGGYVKNATKLYPVGITETNSGTQSYYTTSYSNTNVYIGTDNCLYSNGTKVSVEGHNHDGVYSTTDTKNTVGATGNNGVKLFLVGAREQTANPQSYTHSNTFISSSGLFNTPGIYTNKFQAPTSNGGTTYGPGSSGQVLMTNGSNIYWGTVVGTGSTTDDTTHSYSNGVMRVYSADTGGSGVTAGSYGPSANASPSHSGTFSVPYFEVNSGGRITAAHTRTITLPSDNNTHYTTHLYAGSGSAANASTTNGNTKITVADNTSARDSITIKGTGTTSVTSDANGVITINSTNSGATVTLNGQSTSSANFYAPTTAGTEGMFLMSRGSGAPEWESISLNSGHLMADQLTISGTATVNGQFSSSTKSYFNAGLTSYGDVTIGKSTSGNDLTIYGSIYDGYGDEFATESWVTQNFVAKCLLEGTQITMSDNSLKNIEDVKPGDIVKSIDIETGEETESVVLLNSVGDVKNYYYMLMFEDGSCLKTNWTHDVYNATKETWVKSDCELYLDDEIIKSDGNRVKFIGTIDTIGTPNGRMCKFYDIVVSNNCYYADNILCSSNPITQYRWLNPVLNKRAKFHPVPEILKEIISSYKDEDNRESDLVHNEEYIKKYIPSMALKMKKEAKLRALKAELVNTDYVTLKMSEGVEVTPAVQETLDARAWWRKLYNEVEAELNVIYEDINKLKVQYSVLGEDVLLDNISLRKKFFLESCRKANNNFQEFVNYYKETN